MITITDDLLHGLQTLLSVALGTSFRIDKLSPMSSGNINTTLQLVGNGPSLFVKIRPTADAHLFDAEVAGLRALARCDAFRIPRVIAQGTAGDKAVLVLEWLQLKSLTDQDDGIRAGEALASLHAISDDRYGWEVDNFIGSTPQHNAWHDNWVQFFVRHRLEPQFQLAAQRGFKGALQRDGAHLMERAPALFLDYRPRVSLLHGDLWSGNVGVLDTGEPTIFDPACYYGDREADLAMTELFGGFPLSFYSAYRRTAPLDVGYERRKPFYNLYHVLNHLNLFGRGYLGQAERMAHKIAAELSRG